MLEYIEGDIFNSPAQVIVNTVNTVGVMGKGLALSFKKRYPEMFESYKKVCDKQLLKTGKLMLYHCPDYWILLFPTKEHWRHPSKLEYIEAGLVKFVQTYAEKNITSIAFPKLGCGNGELNWEDVRPLMEKYLKPLPIDVYIYLGPGKDSIPEHKIQEETTDWLRKDSKNMSFRGVIDDIVYQSAILPYEFSAGSTVTKSDEGLLFKIKEKEFNIEYEELHKMWDEIRDDLVFFKDSTDEKKMFCDLLLNLGYLSNIRLLNKKTNQLEDGYQLNEGLGRAFGWEAC